MEAAELEMEYNVQIMLNYLKSIVNYKFGNQYIYCYLHKYYKLYSLHKHDNHNSYYSLRKVGNLNMDLNQ